MYWNHSGFIDKFMRQRTVCEKNNLPISEYFKKDTQVVWKDNNEPFTDLYTDKRTCQANNNFIYYCLSIQTFKTEPLSTFYLIEESKGLCIGNIYIPSYEGSIARPQLREIVESVYRTSCIQEIDKLCRTFLVGGLDERRSKGMSLPVDVMQDNIRKYMDDIE